MRSDSGADKALTQASNKSQAALQAEVGLAVTGSILGLGAAAGVVATIQIHRNGKARLADFGEWDPTQ